MPNRIIFYIAIIMVSSAMGSANNLAISITSSVFGRYDFAKAWDVIYIKMDVIVRIFGFSRVAELASITGSYTSSFYRPNNSIGNRACYDVPGQ